MDVAICDDNINDLNNLKKYLTDYLHDLGIPFHLFTYSNTKELLADFESKRFSLIFLDIYMYSPDGMQTARLLREKDSSFHLIFTTISLEHPLQAFGVSATDYLVKPLTYHIVKGSLDKCGTLFNLEANYLIIQYKKLVRKILLKDIYWSESKKRFTILHLKNESVETDLIYQELKFQMEAMPFLDCIRGCFVNMNHIDSVLEYDFLLTNGEQVPLRKRGALKVKQAYYDYLWSRTRGETT